jgi:hypothetical protein
VKSVRVLSLALITALIAGGALAAVVANSPRASGAQIGAPIFELPFPCGEVWNGATRSPHPSGSGATVALDFNWGSGFADYGKPVVASASGTVVQFGSGANNTVKIDHGNGWATHYLHMSAVTVQSTNPLVLQGQVIGYVGDTGATGSPHLHYEQRLNDVVQHIHFGGNAIVYGPLEEYNGPAFTSNNCGGGGATYVMTASSPTVWIVVGGAKFELTPEQYHQLGDPTPQVAQQHQIDALGSVPSDGTFLKSATSESIYQIIGEARYLVPDPTTLGLLGGSNSWAAVPDAWIEQIPDSAPTGIAYMRNPATQEIYQIVNGAKYKYSTMDEYRSLAPPDGPAFVNTTQEFIDRVTGTVPTGTTYLRDPVTEVIYEVTGGAKRALVPQEWAQLQGVGATWIHVSGLWLAQIPWQPGAEPPPPPKRHPRSQAARYLCLEPTANSLRRHNRAGRARSTTESASLT